MNTNLTDLEACQLLAWVDAFRREGMFTNTQLVEDVTAAQNVVGLYDKKGLIPKHKVLLTQCMREISNKIPVWALDLFKKYGEPFPPTRSNVTVNRSTKRIRTK